MRFLLTLLLGICAVPGVAANAASREVNGADRKFLAEVVSAVHRKDAAWIVAHSCLPMASVTEGRRQVLGNKEYAEMVRQALTADFCARFQADAEKKPFKNWRGVMIGGGILWFEEIKVRDSDPWTYAILAFGGFAFQMSDEISGGEDPPNQPSLPIRLSVMPRACARVTPARLMAGW
jgi:hypothetical protein